MTPIGSQIQKGGQEKNRISGDALGKGEGSAPGHQVFSAHAQAAGSSVRYDASSQNPAEGSQGSASGRQICKLRPMQHVETT